MGQRTLPGSPSVVEILTLAQRRAVRGLAARLADDGCTLDQWRVLRALGDGEGHLMGELADALQIAQPTLTRVVESMVDAAWVYRRPSAEDRRRVAVHLSRQGRVRLSRLDAIVKAHEDALLASPDWDEVQTRISGLAGKF
jgi:DNA-binding MarR family transcriptional regulator